MKHEQREDREKMRNTPTWLVTYRLPVAILALWLMSVVLMISLLHSSIRGPATSERPNADMPGQVQHFVCTADGDGTILRCVFSAIAKPPLSTSS